MLHAQGSKIYENGTEVFLRGINLGSYLNLENFMTGHAGAEHQFREYFYQYAGKEKYEFFFDRYRKYFFSEEDAEYLEHLGMNVVRLPVNYRIFEDDNSPYEYKKEGFDQIDYVLELCRKHYLYVMLDLHSAQGCQNKDWHSDCSDGNPKLFTDPEAQKRVVALWQMIAEHYKNEETIGAYDLLNEADARGKEQIQVLNSLNRELVRVIREKDPDHMIVINGNHFNRDFDGFDKPYAENLLFAIHHYAPGSLQQAPYPDMSGDILFDKRTLLHQLQIRKEYAAKYGVPVWVSEFGILDDNPKFTEMKQQFLHDQLDVFQQEKCHWTLWSYKDVGNMGLLRPKSDQPWMSLALENIRLKKKYWCDYCTVIGERWPLSAEIGKYVGDDFGWEYEKVRNNWENALIRVFNDALAEKFARELSECSMDELESMAASFKFENCLCMQGWEQELKNALTR